MFRDNHPDAIVQRGIDEARACQDRLERGAPSSSLVAHAVGRLRSRLQSSFSAESCRLAVSAGQGRVIRQRASLLLTTLIILGLTLSSVLVGSSFPAGTGLARAATPEAIAALGTGPMLAGKQVRHTKARRQEQRQDKNNDHKQGDTRARQPDGLTDPPDLRVRNGELVPMGDTKTTVSAQSAEPTWSFGPSSHTYYQKPITGTIFHLTDHKVGYWGTADLSYPKVGDLYYGSVLIANVGTVNTAVAVDIVLPPNTLFDITSNDPNKRVLCYLWNFDTDEMTELTGANCDQTPSPLLYGAHFAPWSDANQGFWWIAPGQAVFIVFPISSRTELKGWSASPPDCLIGSVFAAGVLGDGWDRPQPTDTCPLPDGPGASQGVFVATGTPTVAPPVPTVDDGTQPPPNKDKKKGKKGKGKDKKGKGRTH